MNHRRRFIAVLGASTLAMPLRAFPQQIPVRVPRLGLLLFNSPQTDPIAPLVEGLQALGYVDGKTIGIDYRFAEGKAERLPDLAAELVRLKPDVIFAYGGDVALHAKKATGSIPIVAMVSNDPVQSGLVASVSRPGGNVTGITLVYDELAGKVIELFKEAVPAISRVAVLWNPDHADPEFRETQRAATALGVRLQSVVRVRPRDLSLTRKPIFRHAKIEARQRPLRGVSAIQILGLSARVSIVGPVDATAKRRDGRASGPA